ncbi:uncharacterized protein [Typha angustifolia]|uniref:uncharacterized protein n=1 Tax=Typha angustifolia TaxID=59011 RepID=UPI003C2C176A
MAMPQNSMDELPQNSMDEWPDDDYMDNLQDKDYMDELSDHDWPVHFDADDDHTVGSYDFQIPRPSNFLNIFGEEFHEKYKEVDDAILAENFTYLQGLVSKEFIPRPLKNENKEDVVMNLSDAVNLSDDPLLSVVIAHKKSDLALRLVEVMSEENLCASNIYGDTALHVAAANGDVRVVEVIAKKCPKVMKMQNRKRETPLHNAALYGDRDVFWKLVELGSEIKQRREDGSNILHYAITGNAPDLAMEIAMEYPDLVIIRNSVGATPLHLLLTIPEVFRSKLQLGFLDSIIYNCIPLEKEELIHIPKRGGREPEIPTDEEKQSLMTLRRKFPEHYSTLCDLLELIYRFPVTWIGQLVFNVLKQLFPSIQKLQEQKRKQRQTTELIGLLASQSNYWDFCSKGGVPPNRRKKFSYCSNRIEQERKNSSENEILLKQLKCCCQKKDATENNFRWIDSPLIIGAKMGLDEFVKQILTQFPQYAHNLNSEGMNVLQVATKYGHEKIVNDILSMISESNPIVHAGLLFYIHPKTENTILHFAAEKIKNDESFPMQMQYELQYFGVNLHN